MWTTLVLFRLERDSSYDVRYKSLLDAIATLTAVSWDEPTSAIMFVSALQASEVRRLIVARSQLYSDGRDFLEVLDITVQRYAGIGMRDEQLFNALTNTAPTLPAPVPISPRAVGLAAASLETLASPATQQRAVGLGDVLLERVMRNRL